ncbi:PIG-X [Lipomyces oligophaga]|uniref:PIG-X n=1 Tax=Lipomyces oligophaga TaxID=45792 RepID=UPI0034CE3281
MSAPIRIRHTFIVHDQWHQTFRDAADSLELTSDKLVLRDVPGARQDRAVVSLDRVAEKDLFHDLESLRIEISSKENYAHVSPFDRPIPWGTHISIAPRNSSGYDWNSLCRFLERISPETECNGISSFIEMPYGFYLHSPSVSLTSFINYLTVTYSPMNFSDLSSAHYISISFTASDSDYADARTNGRVLAEAYWYYGRWFKTIPSPPKGIKVEVGILNKISDDAEGDMTFGGILAVIGENAQFVPTLFDFAPRHRPTIALPQPVYKPDFRVPYGLHPKHLTVVEGALQVPRISVRTVTIDGRERDLALTGLETSSVTCGLYAYYTLPRFIFVDQYQISDLADAQAGGVKRVVGIWGETDLEIPVWMVDKWGSTMLLELIPPPVVEAIEDDSDERSANRAKHLPKTYPIQRLDVEIPMHSRYEVPDWNISAVVHDIPWPSIFWACNSSSEMEMRKGPFDSNMLGPERLFERGTSFYYILANQSLTTPVSSSALTTKLSIPVVKLEAYDYVQPWTVGVILAGCVWIVYKTFLNYFRDGGIRKQPGNPRKPSPRSSAEEKKNN